MPKVLIVDDEKQILSSLNRLLKDRFQVFTAENVHQAFEVLNNNDIEVIVSDYNLNDHCNGSDLLNMTMEKWPYITRVILTAYHESHIAKDALNRAGVFRFMTKPWDDEHLVSVIEQSARRSRILRNNMQLLGEIEEQNRKIEQATQIIDRELKLKGKKLVESEEVISSVQKQLGSINELLAKISSGRTFRDIVSSTLEGISQIVPCDASSIVNVTGSSDTLSIYANGREEEIGLSSVPGLGSVLDSVRSGSYNPLILGSIYVSADLKKLLLGTDSIQSIMLYPIHVNTSFGRSGTFILVLGRSGKESFDKQEAYLLKDVSASIYAALQRLEMVSYVQSALKQWEDAFNAIMDPLFIVSRGHEIIAMNNAVEKMAGCSSDDARGKKCHQVFRGSSSVCPGCLVSRTLGSEGACSSEGVPCFDNNSILATAYPVRGADGISSVIQYNNDRSAEFKLYKQLIQAEKLAAIGMLAANIAHEMNNPLGGILAYSQLLKKDFMEGDTIHSDLSEIESACKRSKAIISNLMDFSRDTSNDTSSVFSVRKLVNDTLPLMNICLKGHRLSVNISSDDLLMSGNMGQIQQVLFNLITNAVHATPSGGEIRIGADRDEAGNVRIDVSDTGCGINEDVLPRIFEPFFTTKEKGKGTGLGLYVSHGIITEHGGNIRVTSRQGEGTTFSINMPAWSETNDRVYN